MTATPHGDETPFELNEADQENIVMRRRLEASKLVSLQESPKGEKGSDGLVAACLHILKGDAKSPGLAEQGASVLVVLNRVSSARALRERLREEVWPHEAILLTGRSRSVERDELLERYRHRIMAGRKREDSKGKPPLIIVATQCVEVGADLDADALITEACPLDAFRQRLGRLDRLGEIGETHAVCLLRAEPAGKNSKTDPIYGDALVNTWLWLKENADRNGVIDCGIDALSRRLPSEAAERKALCAPAADAPVMFPAYCDLWCQTGPEPAVSPAPEIFLHGPQSGPADVRFVWRADLDPEKPETWTDTIALCPPVAGETLPIPIGQARAWLAQEAPPDCADIEGSPDVDEGRKGKEATNRPSTRKALRWFGPERSEVIVGPGGLRPGDIVILPASGGGCDSEGWNPAASQTADIAMLARMKARRAAVLRLHPVLLDEWREARSLIEPLAGLDTSKELPDDIAARIEQVLSDLKSREDIPDALAQAVAVLQEDTKRRVEPHPSGRGLVVYTRKRLGEIDFTDEDSQSSLARNDVVLLRDHLEDVESRARECSGSLPDEIRQDIALAARLHDIGKADPRFQTLLASGNRLRALRNGLLAKSLDLRADFSAYNAAREKAGYPKGGRHELLSVRLAESCKELLQEACDPDLVLHLIACHHGHARPFAPAVDDPSPIDVAFGYEGKELHSNTVTGLEHLDGGVPERFWRLVRKYGWWGLAYIEACLRLADHRARRRDGTANEYDF
jgi:CRISPR-associated endonuclease/helicase Cas3